MSEEMNDEAEALKTWVKTITTVSLRAYLQQAIAEVEILQREMDWREQQKRARRSRAVAQKSDSQPHDFVIRW